MADYLVLLARQSLPQCSCLADHNCQFAAMVFVVLQIGRRTTALKGCYGCCCPKAVSIDDVYNNSPALPDEHSIAVIPESKAMTSKWYLVKQKLERSSPPLGSLSNSKFIRLATWSTPIVHAFSVLIKGACKKSSLHASQVECIGSQADVKKCTHRLAIV